MKHPRKPLSKEILKAFDKGFDDAFDRKESNIPATYTAEQTLGYLIGWTYIHIPRTMKGESPR
jgi:hypothetical protein